MRNRHFNGSVLMLLAFAGLSACNDDVDATGPDQPDPHTELGLQNPDCGGDVVVQAEAFSATSSAVAIEACEDCGDQNYITGLNAGEWFEVEVSVDALGLYGVQLAAVTTGGTMQVQRVTADGASTLAVVTLADTEADLACSASVDLALPEGTHTLRFVSDGDVAGVDYLAVTAGESTDVVVDAPVLNRGPRINPLKGWNSGWWVDADYASVGFQYIEWGVLEPKENEFDWDAVEAVLGRPGSKGRHLIVQFVVDWDWEKNVEDNYKGPDWLLEEVGVRRGTDPWVEGREMRATDYNDEDFKRHAKDAIAELFDHYKDDPRVFVIQVGLLGFWGEWHNYPQTSWAPSDETKQTIFDAYTGNQVDPILLQARYPDDSITVPTPGMGYTNGSATITPHGQEFNDGLQEGALWENGPIGGEWPPNIEDALWAPFFDGQRGLDYIKDGHYSTLLPPRPEDLDAKVPGWRAEDSEFMKSHREFGYNFHVDAVRQVRSQAGGPLLVELDVSNSGIAPFYVEWDVELAILDNDNNVVQKLQIETDLREWAPATSTTLTAYLDAELTTGAEYRIGLRMVQPGAVDAHDEEWALNARNSYIELSNDIDQVAGAWDPSTHALVGGWNLVATVGGAASK
ncbi:MAG: DUF4832 domain-containing protein [Myxococcota bacterium]